MHSGQSGGRRVVMMTRRTLYQTIRQRLQAVGIEDAGIESGFLLEFLLGKPLPQLLMDGELPVPEAIVMQAETLCQRRAVHYPLQYLFGSWEFYSLSFEIGEGVLIPRADTETLAVVFRQRLQRSYQRFPVLPSNGNLQRFPIYRRTCSSMHRRYSLCKAMY